jgi:hypothetical protein
MFGEQSKSEQVETQFTSKLCDTCPHAPGGPAMMQFTITKLYEQSTLLHEAGLQEHRVVR